MLYVGYIFRLSRIDQPFGAFTPFQVSRSGKNVKLWDITAVYSDHRMIRAATVWRATPFMDDIARME